MKTFFPKKELHTPKWYVIDAKNKTLGRLATTISKVLRGKETNFFTPGIDQGNYVVVLNTDKIEITGKKDTDKLYFRNSQRPGNLKKEMFADLKKRLPTKILEKAIYGMLPKGILGRKYFKRLYLYCTDQIPYKKNFVATPEVESNWITLNI